MYIRILFFETIFSEIWFSLVQAETVWNTYLGMNEMKFIEVFNLLHAFVLETTTRRSKGEGKLVFQNIIFRNNF